MTTRRQRVSVGSKPRTVLAAVALTAAGTLAGLARARWFPAVSDW